MDYEIFQLGNVELQCNADPSGGSGLVGVKDRVETQGGTITVNSPLGAGTSLHVQLPLEE